MATRTTTVINRQKELYPGLEDSRSRKAEIRLSLPVKRPDVVVDKAKVSGKEIGAKERMLQIPEVTLKNKAVGYSSKGEPVKVPNGATHYAAVVHTDNSVMQEKAKPRENENDNPVDTAKNLYGKIKDAAEIGNIIELQKDGVDVVRAGDKNIIKGARTPAASDLGIKGTRYNASTPEKYPNLGKLIDPKTAAKNALSVKGEVFIEPGLGIISNIIDKAPKTKIAADFAVDVTKAEVTLAATVISTAVIADTMLGSKNLNGTPKLPVLTTAALGGLAIENAVDQVLENVSNKAKDALKKGLDKLVNTDKSKPNNGKSIERHDPPQKHERSEKTEKNEKPIKEDKPVKQDPFKEEKPDNKQPKNDKPINTDKSAKQDPFKEEKPDNKQPKNDKPINTDKPAKQDPFKEEKPDNKQPKNDKPATKTDKPSSSKSKPAPNARPRGRLLD